MLINFCDTVCIYNFQPEIKLVLSLCFPTVHSHILYLQLKLCYLSCLIFLISKSGFENW